MRGALGPALLLGALSGCHPEASIPLGAAAPAPGSVQVLDAASAEGDTGWWPTVTFDAAARPHIAYCDAHHGDVRYAHEEADGWVTTTVVAKGAVGKYVALATDPAGHPAIAYYNQDTQHLRYTWEDAAGQWHDEPVAWGREAGIGATLRFAADGVAHLFYYLPSGSLVHAARRDGAWHKRPLAAAQSTYSVRISAVVRQDGIWLSYVDWKAQDPGLYVGLLGRAGGQDVFTPHLVRATGNPGWHSQLLFTGDVPTLLHSARLTERTDLARPTADGGWAWSRLIPRGSTFAAATWRGALQVAYQDTSDLKRGASLRIAREGAPAWALHNVDGQGPVGRYIDMAISPAGRMLVVYYADATRSLKLYDEALP